MIEVKSESDLEFSYMIDRNVCTHMLLYIGGSLNAYCSGHGMSPLPWALLILHILRKQNGYLNNTFS